jgi:NADH:ubiquinone oxidoreductase subunit 4 (subunit M)
MATCRLFAQRDLKKIVALTTVIEMNWLIVCLGLGGALFEQTAVFLVIAHSITTAIEFLYVELLSKRFGTRDLTQLSGLFATAPFLGAAGLVATLITIGFPGTPLFFAKMLFFVGIAAVSWPLTALLGVVLLVVLPVFFMRVWVPVWFGLARPLPTQQADLS